MFQRIVVPIDGSDRAWDAARVADVLAEEVDATWEVVSVVHPTASSDGWHDELTRQIDARGPWVRRPTPRTIEAAASDAAIGAVLAEDMERSDGSILVMSSTGRGRSAAVLGSVADEVLRASFGPIIVVGPNVDPARAADGVIVVPLDGSTFAERSIPIAAAWGIALGSTPWIVEVLEPDLRVPPDVSEASYAQRVAADMRRASHHDVEFEVLRGRSVPRAVNDFAESRDARFVLLSTHGRSGLERLAAGSVAAAIVRDSVCPVVLHRPPTFALD